MSRTKKIMVVILLVFIMMQFIRPPLNNRGKPKRQQDFVTQFNVPASVAGVLETSCYDCHSNSTDYPLYAHIQPFGWLLARHIRNGKEDLNFSEFAGYSKRRRLSKLKSVHNSIKDGSMPLSSYTLMHGDAKLSEENKSLILKWTTMTIDSLSRERE